MRLFVAADLPDAVRAVLPTTLARGKLHVTLVFLGEREAAPVLPGLAPPAAPLRVTGRVRLGRVHAAGLEDPTGAWTAYQAALATALGVPEDHPWRPHVTLARKRLPEPFDVPSLSFVPPSLSLLRSASGRYEPLVTVPARS